MAAHSDSVYISADCGPGVIDVTDSLGRGANLGSVIVVGTKEHHEAATSESSKDKVRKD